MGSAEHGAGLAESAPGRSGNAAGYTSRAAPDQRPSRQRGQGWTNTRRSAPLRRRSQSIMGRAATRGPTPPAPTNSGLTVRPSSRLLPAYLSDECCSHGEGTVGDHQRKRCQTPWRWSERDLRAFPGVEFGVVARTFQIVLVAYVRLHPLRDGTSGVSANQRIRDDAVGRSRSRLVVEFAWIKLYEDNLVEPRALADHRGFRVLRPGVQGRPVDSSLPG